MKDVTAHVRARPPATGADLRDVLVPVKEERTPLVGFWSEGAAFASAPTGFDRSSFPAQ